MSTVMLLFLAQLIKKDKSLDYKIFYGTRFSINFLSRLVLFFFGSKLTSSGIVSLI